MIKLINEELYSYGVEKCVDARTANEFTKLHLYCTNKIQHLIEGKKNYANNNQTVNHSKVLLPAKRDIISISISTTKKAPSESTLVSEIIGFDKPMSLNVQPGENGKPYISVRCKDYGDDRANLYVIAFPFNGLIKPIEFSEEYRIYKGMILTSARPFFFNRRRYKKILYLVCEVNKNLFNADHKYHTDKVSISLESFAIFPNENKEKNTNREKFTLDILDGNGTYNIDWEYEVLDKPVFIDNTNNTPLWTTFIFDKREQSAPQKPRTYATKEEVSTASKTKEPKEDLSKDFTKPVQKAPRYNKHGILIDDSAKGSSFNYSQYDDYYEDDDYAKPNKRSKKGKNKKGKNNYDY